MRESSLKIDKNVGLNKTDEKFSWKFKKKTSSYYIWSQILKVVGFCWKLGKWGKFMLDLNWKKK